jgi:hypothetical protein
MEPCDATSESEGFASQECGPMNGAARRRVSFGRRPTRRQERDPRMGLRDAAKRIRRIRQLVARGFSNLETLRGRSQGRIVRQRRA